MSIYATPTREQEAREREHDMDMAECFALADRVFALWRYNHRLRERIHDSEIRDRLVSIGLALNDTLSDVPHIDEWRKHHG